MTGGGHADLTAAAARGDDEALAALVRAYHDRVYRFGLRVCRDGYDTDDAVQEAFTKLAKRPEVMGDPGALSWLLTVVRNACLRMLRPLVRERRPLGEQLEEDTGLPPDALDPQQALKRWELIHSVHAAIADLACTYREVLILRDLEGLPGEQTCQDLGLEQATMKTRLHRARAQLHEALLRRGARSGHGKELS
jgi:RNA polymerase sigma-70 factor (ECF subfamily)